MTAAKEGSARDVLPVRQKNYSKVDYCNCPRHLPHLWKRVNSRFSIQGKSTRISEKFSFVSITRPQAEKFSAHLCIGASGAIDRGAAAALAEAVGSRACGERTKAMWA